jgi:hypothetical protein
LAHAGDIGACRAVAEMDVVAAVMVMTVSMVMTVTMVVLAVVMVAGAGRSLDPDVAVTAAADFAHIACPRGVPIDP